MNWSRFCCDCVLVVFSALLLWPGIFPTDTDPSRGFARGMRAFAAVGLFYGLLSIALLLAAIDAYVGGGTVKRLAVVKTVAGWVALGIIIGLVISGQFAAYCRIMRKRKQ
jgi:hypothetical protein